MSTIRAAKPSTRTSRSRPSWGIQVRRLLDRLAVEHGRAGGRPARPAWPPVPRPRAPGLAGPAGSRLRSRRCRGWRRGGSERASGDLWSEGSRRPTPSMAVRGSQERRGRCRSPASTTPCCTSATSSAPASSTRASSASAPSCGCPGQAAFFQAPGSTNDHDLGTFQIGSGRRARPPAGRGTVGLYHLAWEVDTLAELERLAGVLTERGALVGASDHVTTKSLYAQDPDGIEFEVCWIAAGRR